jgi:uncharacterized protein YjiK
MNKAFVFAILMALSACSGPARSAERGSNVPDCDSARVIAKLPPQLREVSGIALSARTPGILWVHNDDSPAIFAIDTTGAIQAQIRVTGFENRDWEDIAAAPCGNENCLFIGDIGDNVQDTKRRTVYRIAEPLLTDTATSIPAEYWFTMPDKSHDSEALAVMADGRMFVVTKGRSGPITVYAFPQPLVEKQLMTLQQVSTLSPGLVQLPEMVTGGDAFAPNMIALRMYGGLQFYRVRGDSLESLYDAPYDLQTLGEPQGEGVTVRSDGAVFLTSEKSVGESALLSRLQCNLPD